MNKSNLVAAIDNRRGSLHQGPCVWTPTGCTVIKRTQTFSILFILDFKWVSDEVEAVEWQRDMKALIAKELPEASFPRAFAHLAFDTAHIYLIYSVFTMSTLIYFTREAESRSCLLPLWQH